MSPDGIPFGTRGQSRSEASRSPGALRARSLLLSHTADQLGPAVEDRQHLVPGSRRQADHHSSDADILTPIEPVQIFRNAENRDRDRLGFAPGLGCHLPTARQKRSNVSILRAARMRYPAIAIGEGAPRCVWKGTADDYPRLRLVRAHS